MCVFACACERLYAHAHEQDIKISPEQDISYKYTDIHTQAQTPRVCVCVCVCVRERERERERERVCARSHDRPRMFPVANQCACGNTHQLTGMHVQATRGAHPMDDVDYEAIHRALQDRHDQSIVM